MQLARGEKPKQERRGDNRVLCDSCGNTIADMYRSCKGCGNDVCMRCCEARRQKTGQAWILHKAPFIQCHYRQIAADRKAMFFQIFHQSYPR